MRVFSGLVCVVAAALAMPALANDTAAQLTTGGLEFIVNDDIKMLSEELFISSTEIRVIYEFQNNTDKDQKVLVAFPMPDIVPDWWSPTAFPDGPNDNLFNFKTTFNGQPVKAELHEYAIAAGVDRSDYLREKGLSLVSFAETTSAATDALDEAATAEMLHLGLLVPDIYDVGEGMETHYYPMWTYRATYTWEANFPAGQTVKVEHRYKPSVGGTTGVTFLSEPYEGFDPAAEYRTRYCTDESFVNAVRKTVKTGDDPWAAPFYESWISYILTTGGNWGGGYIPKFRLVVDKGDEANLVSFCGDNIKKIGPTTFEMVATDFYPEKELDILILQRHEDF
jgi:hypothetical protein